MSSFSDDYSYDDITPVSLNDEDPQICQILYDDEFRKVMGILLALAQKNEYSERALSLTEQGIELLASHYTIWIYRFDILTHLNKDLLEELDWCEQIALENEKNYQIWNYRQLVINRIISTNIEFDPHREHPIINAMLESDPKNHHVWSYRKWLAEKFDLYDDPKELQFVDGCILMDFRNNSAWSHRFFLKFGRDINDTEESTTDEIEFVKKIIRQSPQNPSTWNYLIGIYEKKKRNFAELEPFCNEFTGAVVRSSFALEILGRIYLEQGKFKESVEVYDSLIEKYDPIRRNYWEFQKGQIQG